MSEDTLYGKELMVDAIYEYLKNTEDLPDSVKAVTKKAIGAVLDVEKELIMQIVATGGKVRYIGFGSYEQRARKARKGRNPQTGVEIDIDAKNVPAFAPGKDFKRVVQ